MGNSGGEAGNRSKPGNLGSGAPGLDAGLGVSNAWHRSKCVYGIVLLPAGDRQPIPRLVDRYALHSRLRRLLQEPESIIREDAWVQYGRAARKALRGIYPPR